MRANVGINPKILTDIHLVAEYRELMIPFGINKKKGLPKTIPSQFTLNKGHINFFRNKLTYLEKRWNILRQEMISRGFEPSFNKIPYEKELLNDKMFNDWKPTVSDSMLIKERIIERIKEKPHLYKLKGVSINVQDYIELINKEPLFAL